MLQETKTKEMGCSKFITYKKFIMTIELLEIESALESGFIRTV